MRQIKLALITAGGSGLGATLPIVFRLSCSIKQPVSDHEKGQRVHPGVLMTGDKFALSARARHIAAV